MQTSLFLAIRRQVHPGCFWGLDGLSEMHVLTQTFSAEYGRNGGGVIEAIICSIRLLKEWGKGKEHQNR
jgi:hypothetical protein